MSATTLRKHAAARKPRRSLAAILLRRTAPEAAAPEVPRGEHPYPKTSPPGLSPGTAIAVPPEVLAAVRDGSIGTAPRHALPEARRRGFAGASLAGQPDSAVPPWADAPAPEAAHEDDPDRWNGLTEMDIKPVMDRPFCTPEPSRTAAFLRSFRPGGRVCDAILSGTPRFTRLAPCDDGQVAEVHLGHGGGRIYAFAGDRAALDAAILAFVQARDALAYGWSAPVAPAAAGEAAADSSEMDGPDPDAEIAETAVLIEQGWAVLRRSREVPWPDDATAGAQDGLRDALQRFGALLNGLVPGNPDPDPAALDAAAQVVRVRCGDLADLAGETSGDAVPETEEAADGAA